MIMTSYIFAQELTDHPNEALKFVQLLDATLDITGLDNLNKSTDMVIEKPIWFQHWP